MSGRLASTFTACLAACAILMSFAVHAMAQASTDASPGAAFIRLVEEGKYEEAQFFLANGFVTAETIDAGQLFFDVVAKKYASDMAANAKSVERLYEYLARIEPIDLNRPMECGPDYDRSHCLFLTMLMAGAGRETVAYFVERGLDLNARVPGIVPATVPLLLRLGSLYSMDDLNFFASSGMVFGDELYSLEELASYQDRHLSRRGLNLPASFFSPGDQNLLDVLVIALGTGTAADWSAGGARRKALCEFIAYAGRSFSPSFDHLAYLLGSVADFRAANIGRQEKRGNRLYEPFPESCVALLAGMAAAHPKLQEIIARFASARDVETANWLVSFVKKAN